ncbi:MAG: hypothetical protein ACK55Z_14990, partial [bacterium]
PLCPLWGRLSAPSGPREGVAASQVPPGGPAARPSAGGDTSRPCRSPGGGRRWSAGVGCPAAGIRPPLWPR